MVLVGDVVGYVMKCFGEGIYFVVKFGCMCVEVIVEGLVNGMCMVDELDLRVYLDKWDKKYWVIYKVLDIL